jgi:hypothetical protein
VICKDWPSSLWKPCPLVRPSPQRIRDRVYRFGLNTSDVAGGAVVPAPYGYEGVSLALAPVAHAMSGPLQVLTIAATGVGAYESQLRRLFRV